MRSAFCFIVLLLGVAGFAASADAWNLTAKHVNALRFLKDGRIYFTLFNSGSTGAEFRCGSGTSGQWFYVTACPSGNETCSAAMSRMASLLLSAKLAGKAVHVQRNQCVVTEVALKP